MNEQSLFISAMECDSAEALNELLNRPEIPEDQRARVRALLKSHQEASQFLSTAAPDLLSELVESGVSFAEAGQSIGPYRLLEQIGEGGMGVVYMADQQTPVRRRVAVKVIKPGMDTRQVIARFEAERQALALMDHPNIARIFDAGATSTGRPYFVMELVRGVPLTDYCQRENCSLHQRLELFIDVCRAVQHAHLKGIIHRDIKPSNVMVTLHDGEPVVKMIDFGVAKAMNQQLTERTLFTNYLQMLGTPMYMSPEQAEMSGLDVDTRSDVYSLGVLLYELLTDDTPFEKQRLRDAAYDEMRRIIREEDPPRPSTRITTHGGGATESASQNRHRRNQSELQTALFGELDWIVLRAMEKNRTRRYQSVQQLADDVLRFLCGKVIEARPPSLSYRISKLFQRHRGLVTLTVSFIVFLLIGTTVSTLFAVRAFRAESSASEARKRAETDAAIANRISQFLSEELLSHASPYLTPDRDMTVREVLDRASSRINGHFVNQPLVEANLCMTIGTAYRHLGRYEESVRHLNRASELFHDIHGENHPETLRSQYQLAVSETHRSGSKHAIPRWETTLRRQREFVGEEAPDTLITMGWLAYAYAIERRFTEAESLFAEANSGFARVLGPEHPETLDCLDGMARMFNYQGRHQEAEDLHREILETRRRVLGENHPQFLDSLSAVADMSMVQGRTEEAVELYSQVVETRRQVEGVSHPLTLMDSRSMARALHKSNRLEDARQTCQETLASEEQVFGPDDSRTLWTKQLLAAVCETLGDFTSAIELHQQILESRRRLSGDSHKDTIRAMQNLGAALLYNKQYDEALRIQTETMELLTYLYTRDDPRAVNATIQLMHGLQEAGRLSDSVRIGEGLLQRQVELYGGEDSRTLSVMLQLAYAYKKDLQLAKAKQLFQEVERRHVSMYGETDPTALRAAHQISVVLRFQKRFDEAETILRRVLQTRLATFGENHSDTLESLLDLSFLMEEKGQIREAAMLYGQILPIRKSVNGASSSFMQQDLARAEALAGKLETIEQLSAAADAWEMLWKLNGAGASLSTEVILRFRDNAIRCLESADPRDVERLTALKNAKPSPETTTTAP